MEKTLERGGDKIQKICDALKKETLEPAKREAEKIIEEAQARADHLLNEARKEADRMAAHAKQAIEQERNVFHSSLQQAASQSMEELRQRIEKKLFSEELQELVEKTSQDPKVIADLIQALIQGIEKEGIATKLSAVIPKTASTEKINALLGENVLKKLQGHSVVLGGFNGGVQIKLIDRKMTIDITDEALKELLSSYLRKDYRKLLFKAS